MMELRDRTALETVWKSAKATIEQSSAACGRACCKRSKYLSELRRGTIQVMGAECNLEAASGNGSEEQHLTVAERLRIMGRRGDPVRPTRIPDVPPPTQYDGPFAAVAMEHGIDRLLDYAIPPKRNIPCASAKW